MGMVRYAGKMVTDGRVYVIERQEMEIAKYRHGKMMMMIMICYTPMLA